MGLKSLKLLKLLGIEAGINHIYHVKFITQHVPQKSRKYSWLYIIVGTLYILINLLLRSKKLKLKQHYHILFYVPNRKYKKFLDALTENKTFSFLVIGEEYFTQNVISVSSFYELNRFKHTLILLQLVTNLFIFSIKTKQLTAFKKHYWSLLSLIRRDLIAEALFDNVDFDKYFSFHPVGDFHQVIQNFYKSKFRDTFAIRPTTTSIAKEHQFITTDNLFYKNLYELNVYQQSKLKTINLLKGGLIADKYCAINVRNSKTILFLDTCTNKNPESINIRRRVVSQFLKHVSLFGYKVCYKFHPALIKREILLTRQEIKKYKSQNIDIIKNYIPWDEIKLAIGFDTTLFYDCIIRQIPVLSFRDSFYLFPYKQNEFEKSPIVPIRKDTDLNLINKLLSDELYWNRVKTEQGNWFTRQYNFPNGMYSIIKILEE